MFATHTELARADDYNPILKCHFTDGPDKGSTKFIELNYARKTMKVDRTIEGLKEHNYYIAADTWGEKALLFIKYGSRKELNSEVYYRLSMNTLILNRISGELFYQEYILRYAPETGEPTAKTVTQTGACQRIDGGTTF
jgi:hypothetical protein